VLNLNDRLKDLSRLLCPLMGDDVEIALLSRSESAVVEVDPGQLDQVVVNLAVNARDAMPHGSKLIVETSAMECDEAFAKQHPPMQAGSYVTLAVSDNGIGMDAATLSRIFEPFFTTKEMGKGTGLDLATVYGIVQQSGGHIWVNSEPGRGTTFKIYLPSAAHKVGLDQEAPLDAVLPRREGTTILLVEDDEIMRSLTRQMLVEHGYDVIEVDAAAEDKWTAMVDRGAADAPFGEKSYFFGSNIPGKPRKYLLNSGGRPKLFKEIDKVIRNDYKSFRLSRSSDGGDRRQG